MPEHCDRDLYTSPAAKLPAAEAVRAVVFDAVGTLLEPQPPLAQAYFQHGRVLGSRLSVQEVQERFHAAFARCFGSAAVEPCSEQTERRLWRQVVQDVFGDQPVKLEELFERLWNHFAQARHWRLCPGVEGLWPWLHEQGYLLAVASNFDRRLEAICRHKPPLDLARWVFVCTRLGVRKPSVEFFRRIADHLGLAPQECLMVGDTLRADVLPALAAGWQALWLCTDPVQEKPGCVRIAHLEQLKALLVPDENC